MTAAPLRPSFRFVAAFALCASAAAACSHDTANTTGTNNSGSSNGFTVTIDSGSNLQIAVVGHSIHVEVTGASSSGGTVGGLTATWTIETGGGTLPVATTTTDANGRAANDWTLGTTSGPNTLAVSIAGVSVTISATGSADALRGLIKVSTDSQTVVASSSTPFVVRAVDQFNNAVPGIAVNWTSSAGTLTPAATTTGNSGNAQTTFTTDSLPAKYTITASTPGFAPVTFTLTGR
jgi:Bacterial Ig-like domain (group 1)